MTERAAHLVGVVLPWVPVRQWVLTVPYRLRYQMAWNHGLSRAVLRVYTRVLLDMFARGARERGIAGEQTGMVVLRCQEWDPDEPSWQGRSLGPSENGDRGRVWGIAT
jgi:hypothetical protein